MEKNNRKLITAVTASLVVAGVIVAGGLVWNNRRNNNNPDTAQPSSTSKTTKPTADNAGGDIKQEIVNKENVANQQPSETVNGRKKVTPVITSANQTNVSAYVPGVFEEGGKCTATLTQGSQTLSKDSEGFGNVSYTQCAPLDLTTLSFPSKGTWAVTITYASGTAQGVSNSQDIEVR